MEECLEGTGKDSTWDFIISKMSLLLFLKIFIYWRERETEQAGGEAETEGEADPSLSRSWTQDSNPGP